MPRISANPHINRLLFPEQLLFKPPLHQLSIILEVDYAVLNDFGHLGERQVALMVELGGGVNTGVVVRGYCQADVNSLRHFDGLRAAFLAPLAVIEDVAAELVADPDEPYTGWDFDYPAVAEYMRRIAILAIAPVARVLSPLEHIAVAVGAADTIAPAEYVKHLEKTPKNKGTESIFSAPSIFSLIVVYVGRGKTGLTNFAFPLLTIRLPIR